MAGHRRHVNCILPPHLLRRLLDSRNAEIRHAALNTLLSTARLRGERALMASFAAAPGGARRTIYDCRHSTSLRSVRLTRSEDGEASRDDAVNRAFDGFGATRTFYREILNRDSIDDQGRRLDGYVHYGRAYNNAFWNGREMVFGDGDGVLFTDFTKSLDVIAHELTHGVTEFAAGLEYHDQPGALNESMSDVFGSLVKQWSLKQSAEEADWLIGADVFTPDIRADALRSMKAPGTAYDNPDLGKDPQPDSMDKYAQLPNTDEGDNGGVHINSGIPNKAFYVTAREIGGFAWEAPGHIWYEALRASGPNTTFQEFADTTYQKAGQLYGAGSAQQKAVFEGWAEVKIKITGVDAAPPPAPGDKELITLLVKQVDDLSATVKQLAEELNRIKSA
ncbi:MAG: M4 family metallopeptidase [Alphaproteobacteria bacterium]